ncbi:hypothetical protein SCLCIDRAFT_33465 [Scleroderma citrinum Foug A]|uniref:Uncharacterized protein n=1 Tax=Scleroderma citrinum Foug A TaxID=1036808 RepID=A0A0C2YNT6_9AGAM|nr:hypothetical protein SCLCIDRAFT_33465 [Scleroderma citrinum Foug A]
MLPHLTPFFSALLNLLLQPSTTCPPLSLELQWNLPQAEKAVDDKHLKDTKAAKEEAAKQGVERLALMEMEAEAKANDVKASKPKPRPRPQKWLKKTVNGIDKETNNEGPSEHEPSQLRMTMKEAIKDCKTQKRTLKREYAVVIPKETVKKFAQGGQVKTWVADVAATETNNPTSPAPSTKTSLTVFPSSYTPVSLSDLPVDEPNEIFADTVDDRAEKLATMKHAMALGTQTVMITPVEESEDELDTPISSLHVTPRVTKRKAPLISDSEAEHTSEASIMEIDEPASKVTSISIQAKASDLPQHKRIKHEEMPSVSLATLSVSSADSTSPPSSNLPEWACDADGYIIDTVKKHSEYNNKDLPVPSDHCWSRLFIPMATLWCSVQKNVWSVPNEELASALQLIFNVMYPDIKHLVTTSGSVFSVTTQCLSEWQNGFGSSALAMMLDFFSSLDDDVDIRPDLNLIDTEGLYRSTFLLELIATAHLSSIAACVHVPGWDTQAMATGKNGEGVIAMVSAALEHAIKFIVDGTIDVEQVLKDMANNADGKMKVKLPKVLNRAMGRVTSSAFQFSAVN